MHSFFLGNAVCLHTKSLYTNTHTHTHTHTHAHTLSPTALQRGAALLLRHVLRRVCFSLRVFLLIYFLLLFPDNLSNPRGQCLCRFHPKQKSIQSPPLTEINQCV